MGSIAWYKVVKGTPVQLPSANLPGLSVKSSVGKSSIVRKDLILSNADSSHSGLYECALRYKGLTLEKSVHVDVRGKYCKSYRYHKNLQISHTFLELFSHKC